MLDVAYFENQLCVYLQGEIDHCQSLQLREELEEIIQERKADKLYLDFARVSFIDSSGVGMIIGRYKTMAARGGTISAGRMSDQVLRLFKAAGLHRIIPIVEHGGQYGEE